MEPLDKFKKIAEIVLDKDHPTSGEVASVIQAVLKVISDTKEKLENDVNDLRSESRDQILKEVTKAETRLSKLINDSKTSKEATEKILNNIKSEVSRLEKLIPKNTDFTDLSNQIRDLKDRVSKLPTTADLVNELENLKGEERLDKSAIKGLEDYDEVAQMARQPRNGSNGGLTRVFTDGSTITGTGRIGDPLVAIAGSGAVDSVNGATGVVVLDADDIDDTATTNKFVTADDITNLGNLSGTNTGDQTSVTGNAGTATKLATARTIAGVSFDGSANINIGIDGLSDVDTSTVSPTDGQVLTWDNANTKWKPATSAGSGDMLASTYDPNAVAGDVFDQDNMVDGTTNKNYTATEKTKLSGIEASADVTDAGNVGSVNSGATAKTTPVDADTFPMTDTEASSVIKKLSFTNLKAFLKTYFDTLYAGVLGADDNYVTDAEKTKLSNISVTQPVDLDTIETRVNALDAAVVLKGSWDASAGTFPGSGSAQAGESYIVSTGGTVDSVVFVANDRIVAITDNASTTTYASNWLKLDYTDQVLSVAGKTGAVTLDADDIDDTSTTNKFTTASEITKLSGIEASADVTDATNVAAAGAVMESDTSTASMSFVIDEDNMASDSATKVPTQQSVKAYVDANAGGGITWNEITGTSQTASVDNGYIANNAGLVTVTIPTTAAVGSVVRVAGVGAGGWKIAQNASEIIHFGNLASTTGTGGYIASTNRYDAVELVCVVADTEWAVISSVGNITVN